MDLEDIDQAIEDMVEDIENYGIRTEIYIFLAFK